MSLRRRRRAVLATALVLGLAPVASAGLYRWVTPEGRVEVGPFPPPGVHAEPWKPEDENKPKSATPESAVPIAPAQSPETTPAPRGSGRWVLDEEQQRQQQAVAECQEKRARSAELVNKREMTEQEVARLEKKISDLEDSLVAAEDSQCVVDSYGNTRDGCQGGSFDRDASLEKARRDLEKAQRKLGDLEQKERAAKGSDDPCAKLPASRDRGAE